MPELSRFFQTVNHDQFFKQHKLFHWINMGCPYAENQRPIEKGGTFCDDQCTHYSFFGNICCFPLCTILFILSNISHVRLLDWILVRFFWVSFFSGVKARISQLITRNLGQLPVLLDQTDQQLSDWGSLGLYLVETFCLWGTPSDAWWSMQNHFDACCILTPIFYWGLLLTWPCYWDLSLNKTGFKPVIISILFH